MNRQAENLRGLLESSGIVRIIGAHNALGAKLAERAGFDGVWSSGLEISTSYAVPDANILTMSEFLSVSQSMTDSVRIPVIADCDTGYGNSNNVIHLVQKYEAAGIAAVCLEDKAFPKVNSFVPGRQELAPVAEFVGKIMAAKNAQRSSDFVVIARIEALIAGWSQEEALKRALAYVKAGADAILIHSKSKTPQEIIDFVAAYDCDVPLVVVPTTYHSITARELEDLGIKMVIYANHGLRASVKAMLDVYSRITTDGSTASIEDEIAPMDLIFQLQDMHEMKKNESIFLRTAVEQTRAIVPAAGDHKVDPTLRDIMADVPISMLDVNGKPLLQRQVEILNANSIGNITVVGGYKGDRIDVDGVKLIDNPDWEQTGDLYSCMCGDRDQPGRVLIAYADILFDVESVARLLKSEDDITLLVSREYGPSAERHERVVDLALVERAVEKSHRSLDLGHRNRVLKIGKQISPREANSEFAGLALFSNEAFGNLAAVFDALQEENEGVFHEAGSVREASLTDLVQELIDRGHNVRCVEVSSGWLEIRSFEDYKLASRLVAV